MQKHSFKLFFFVFFRVLILVCWTNSYAQDEFMDIGQRIKNYAYKNPVKAKQLSHQLLRESIKTSDYKAMTVAYFWLAQTSGGFGEKDSTMYYYDKAIHSARELKDKKREMYLLINVSDYYFSLSNYEKALELYEKALEIADKVGSDTDRTEILIGIGQIKNKIGKHQDAILIFKDSYKNDISLRSTKTIELELAKTYLKLNKLDSCRLYLNKGLIESENTFEDFEIRFLILKGHLYIKEQDLTRAENVFLVAERKNRVLKNIEFDIEIKLCKANLQTKRKNYLRSISLLKSIEEDSLVNHMSDEDNVRMFKMLALSYKSIDSINLSNIYYQKFIDINNKRGIKQFDVLEDVHQLDIKSLNREKERENRLKKVFLIASVLILIGFLFYFIKKTKKDQVNQYKFNELIEKLNEVEQSRNDPKVDELANKILLLEEKIRQTSQIASSKEEVMVASVLVEESEEPPMLEQSSKVTTNGSQKELVVDLDRQEQAVLDQNTIELDFNQDAVVKQERVLQPVVEDQSEETSGAYVINDEKVTQILKGLKKLESEQYYLKSNCTLHQVAKKLKTNTAYLSKVVNTQLNKSFSAYINELRINYILIELKNNSVMRSYSISAISEEIGYKSPDSFTKYFKVATGITPSVYIKKINSINP